MLVWPQVPPEIGAQITGPEVLLHRTLGAGAVGAPRHRILCTPMDRPDAIR